MTGFPVVVGSCTRSDCPAGAAEVSGRCQSAQEQLHAYWDTCGRLAYAHRAADVQGAASA